MDSKKTLPETTNEGFDGVTIYREWLDSARLYCRNDNHYGRLLIAVTDFAIYGLEYEGKDKIIKGFIVSISKSIKAQRRKYSNLRSTISRKDYSNSNSNSNSNNTSDKDEEERKKILERIKNQNNGNK